MSRPQRASITLRRIALSALLLLTALVVAAGVASACNPQAHLALDKDIYEAGSVIIATGSYFPADATITISAPTGTTTVQTSPGGGFSIQLTAPAIPGNYTITASRPTGGFAPASFAVIDAAPTPPAPSEPMPGQGPVLPSPHLAPDVAAPTIVRPRRTNEIVYVSRSGTVELFCGRIQAAVRGSCGAISTPTRRRTTPAVRLGPKPFRAGAARRVQIRFHLQAPLVRRIRTARNVRMRATVLARNEVGSQTSKIFTLTLRPPRPAIRQGGRASFDG